MQSETNTMFGNLGEKRKEMITLSNKRKEKKRNDCDFILVWLGFIKRKEKKIILCYIIKITFLYFQSFYFFYFYRDKIGIMKIVVSFLSQSLHFWKIENKAYKRNVFLSISFHFSLLRLSKQIR